MALTTTVLIDSLVKIIDCGDIDEGQKKPPLIGTV